MTSLLKNSRAFKPDFLDEVKQVYTLIDDAKEALLDQLNDQDKSKAKIDCRKGCYYCCGKVVKPTMPELYIIFEHITDKYSRTELGHIMQRLHAHGEQCNQATSVSERTQVYCAFLQDDLCAIHTVKPLSCRGYTSNDVEKCKASVFEPMTDIPTSICHYSPYDIARKSIMKSMYITGFTDVTEELNSGILRLLEEEVNGK